SFPTRRSSDLDAWALGFIPKLSACVTACMAATNTGGIQMHEIVVPAERWDSLYAEGRGLSLMSLIEQKGDAIVSVRPLELNGYLHMANGARFSGIDPDPSQTSTIYAYQLLPEKLFDGLTTTVYHDEEAIAA